MSEINDIDELPEGFFLYKFWNNWPISTERPQPIGNYKNCMYRPIYFRIESNINFNLIMFEDKIGIELTFQSYALNYNCTYILLPRTDRTEMITCKHLY